jgi:hypothetical protein
MGRKPVRGGIEGWHVKYPRPTVANDATLIPRVAILREEVLP